jgi:hypothetical protein
MLFASACSTPVEEIKADADAAASGLPPVEVAANDWPWWRGPGRDGHAAGAVPPTVWTETENVLWRADIPGRGHATPCVWGERVFVATADEGENTCSLLALDRRSGEQLWEQELHRDGHMGLHKKNSHASASPACDGSRVFTTFLHNGGLWVSAVILEGQLDWQSQAGPFQPRHGYGASPVIHNSLVIVSGDNDGSSYLAALDRRTGDIVWRTRRGAGGSYASPVVAAVAGRDQLLLSGQDAVTSYDPNTGEVLWTCDGPAEVTANTLAWRDDLVFASGGYPERGVMCIRADGSGDVRSTHVVWRKDVKAYVPSMLVIDDRLLVTRDDGILACYRATSGESLWTKRLGGGFSASPTIVNGVAFLPNEAGKVFVFRPGEAYEAIAENDLGDGGMASPVIVAGQLLLRTDHRLYCIGTEAEGITAR